MNEFIKRSITSVFLIGTFGGCYMYSSTAFSWFLGIITLIMVTTEWPFLMPSRNAYSTASTIMYPIAPMYALIWLNNRFYTIDPLIPLYPFLVAWTADTCGYLFGKKYGKTKIYPHISPGKSWEGFAASIIGVFIMHTIILPHSIILHTMTWTTNYVVLFVFSIVMTIIEFLGGFFLSYLKRKKGLKDAGFLLPGHGGFLDRFDGVMFVAVTTMLLTVTAKM